MSDIFWQESYDKPSQLYCENLIYPDEYWPVTVRPRTMWQRLTRQSRTIWERQFYTSMNRPLALIGIHTFLGHDRGDVAESDINIETDTGIPLVQRSEHRIFDDYDADVYYDLSSLDAKVQTLRMWLKCNPTTNKSVRYHVGVRVIGREF